MDTNLDLAIVILPNPPIRNPTMYYPLGVLYIAAVVEEKGYTCEVVDMRLGEKPIPKAKYTAFSCTTPEINKAKELALFVKGKTIVGGPHPTLLPEDCEGHFDYVVRGEGEKFIIGLLKDEFGAYELQTEKSLIVNAERLRDLDWIPNPALDKIENPFSDTLFPGEKYGRGEKAATILTSRGCPFKCAYCGNMFNAPVVYRSIHSVASEIKALKNRGINHYRFEDDNFTINPHLESLCKMIKYYNISYKCHTRADLLTEEKAEILVESGCEECGLGLESADNRVLRLNNKKETAEDHARAIQILKKVGIRSKVYFVMGLPGETDETLELNKRFIYLTKPDKWTVGTFSPYPGCDIFFNPSKYGVSIENRDFSNWWNFIKTKYNHRLEGQTIEQMWQRHLDFEKFMESEVWK